MVAAADASNYARKLGIQRDQLVQELGWDERTRMTTSGLTSRTHAVRSSLTRTPTMWSMWSCCGGAMTTATWSTR